MTVNRIVTLLFCFSLLLLSACSSKKAAVPVGHIPKSKPVTTTEEQYGHTVLQKMSEKWSLDYDDPRLDKINEIVDRLTKAANADQEPWHVYLFKAPEVKNAAATRGNHVFVWSGMLDWIQTDDELATILGHELAHVLARHTDPDPNEEVKKMLIRVGAMAAGIAVARGADGGQIGTNLGQVAANVTEQLGRGILVNPYSRQLEHEADHVGLMIMAQAGYDPRQALVFWERASSDPSFGGSKSAFFSTHPPATDRLGALEEAMPLAEQRKAGTYRPTNQIHNHGKPTPKQALPKNDASSSLPKKNEQYAQGWTDKYYDGKEKRRIDSQESRSPTATPSRNNLSRNSRSGSSQYNASQSGVNKSGKNVPTFAIGDSTKQDVIKQTRWRVAAQKAFLYQSASKASKKIGEVRKGGKITSTGSSGEWLKVIKPDNGFILRSDIAPVFGK